MTGSGSVPNPQLQELFRIPLVLITIRIPDPAFSDPDPGPGADRKLKIGSKNIPTGYPGTYVPYRTATEAILKTWGSKVF